MISRETYNKALDIVEAYHKQLFDLAKISPIVQKNKYKNFELLETGDFVECVSRYKQSENVLTLGKLYEVLSVEPEKFYIINDEGKKREYNFWNSMFKPLN